MASINTINHFFTRISALKYWLSIILLFIISGVFSQKNSESSNASISGKILDTQDIPVEFCTIALLYPDSTIVSGDISDEDGNFELTGIVSGTYLIMVQHLEYQKYVTGKFNLIRNEKKIIPDIRLNSSAVKLEEVTVTAKKVMLEIHADKMVFNVAGSPAASGSNGLDLLRKAPGVTVDMDNNIALMGKAGVLVYINGVASRLAGNDLANMLQSMSSDNIESIEIITNPSSRYDAEGNAGIINILLKKNPVTGFNGTLSGGTTKGKYFRSSSTLSLNYGAEKIKSSLDFTFADETIQDDIVDLKNQSGILLDLKSYELRKRNSFNLAAGLEYQFDKKNFFNFTIRAIKNRNVNTLHSITDIYNNPSEDVSNVILSDANLLNPSYNINSNLNYRHQISDKAFLNADVSIGKFITDKNTHQPNVLLASDRETVLSRDDNAFDANTDIDIRSAKLDYELSFKKATLSVGSKYAYISTQNQFKFYDSGSGSPVLDINKSNDFTYSEKVAAVYAVLNLKMNDFLTLNSGVRMEHTDSRGLLVSELPLNDKDVKRNYTDFFPNVSLAYNDNKSHSFSIGAGRRITRPSYQDLNPFETPISQLVFWKGNPFLRPNYIMNYQLSYSYKQKLTILNSYSVTRDFFASIFEIVNENGNRIIPRNMQKATNYGISVSYPQEISKHWEFSAFVEAARRTFNGNLEGTQIDIEAYTYNIRLQNYIKLPWGITMDLNYNHGSDWIWRGSVRVRGNKNVSFGMKKDFFDKRLQIRITGADIFRTDSDYFYNSDYGGILLDGVRSFDNRRFGINATWKFGNQKLKSRKKTSNVLEDELGRLQGSN